MLPEISIEPGPDGDAFTSPPPAINSSVPPPVAEIAASTEMFPSAFSVNLFVVAQLIGSCTKISPLPALNEPQGGPLEDSQVVVASVTSVPPVKEDLKLGADPVSMKISVGSSNHTPALP